MEIMISINGPEITVSVDGGEPQPVESVDQACQIITEAAGSSALAPPPGEMAVEGQEPGAEAGADPNEQAELAGMQEEQAMTGAFRGMR